MMISPIRVPIAVAAAAFVSMILAVPGSAFAAPPDLPRAFVDTTIPSVTGSTIVVGAGEDLQAAINLASLGDEIVLEAGATFIGTFTLPDKGPGTDWIIIRSSAEVSLPPPGTRVSPADVANMPKIEGVGRPVIALMADANAHHYRFIGIEMTPQAGLFASSLNRFAFSNHHIIFDRVYGHGNELGGRRFTTFNGRNMAVINSYIADWWEQGGDSQAIWWTEGQVTLIHNNYLEAAAENIMTGGAGFQESRMPSDITVTNNTFTKKLSWWADDPSYDGINRTVKNLMEFKAGRRILIEANTFTQFWAEEQNNAILFKSTNQAPACITPFSQTEHVTFRYNTINGVANAIRVTVEGICPNGELDVQNILIENNIFTDINLSRAWAPGSAGMFIALLGISNNIAVRHNTAFTPEGDVNGNIAFIDGTHTGLVFENNIMGHSRYGIKGSGLPVGLPTLNANVTNYTYEGNVQYGTQPENNSSNYPAGNFYPATIAAIDFEIYIETGGGNYRLRDTSTFKDAGTDGKDPGVDWDVFEAAQSSTRTRPAPIPDLR